MRKQRRSQQVQQPHSCELLVRLPTLQQLEEPQQQQQEQGAARQNLGAPQPSVGATRPSPQTYATNRPYGAALGLTATLHAATTAAAAREAAVAGLAASARGQRQQQRRGLSGSDPLTHSVSGSRDGLSARALSARRKAQSAERSKKAGDSLGTRPPSGALTSRPSLLKSKRPVAHTKPRLPSPSPWGGSPHEAFTDSSFSEASRGGKEESRWDTRGVSTMERATGSSLWDQRKQHISSQVQGSKDENTGVLLQEQQALTLSDCRLAPPKYPESGIPGNEDCLVACAVPQKSAQQRVPSVEVGAQGKKRGERLQPTLAVDTVPQNTKPGATPVSEQWQQQQQQRQGVPLAAQICHANRPASLPPKLTPPQDVEEHALSQAAKQLRCRSSALPTQTRLERQHGRAAAAASEDRSVERLAATVASMLLELFATAEIEGPTGSRCGQAESAVGGEGAAFAPSLRRTCNPERGASWGDALGTSDSSRNSAALLLSEMKVYAQHLRGAGAPGASLPWYQGEVGGAPLPSASLPPAATLTRVCADPSARSSIPRPACRPGRSGRAGADMAPSCATTKQQLQHDPQQAQFQCCIPPAPTAGTSGPGIILHCLGQMHAALGEVAGDMQRIDWQDQGHLPGVLQPPCPLASQQAVGQAEKQHEEQQEQPGPPLRGERQKTREVRRRPTCQSSAEPRIAKGAAMQQQQQPHRGRNRTRDQSMPPSRGMAKTDPQKHQLERPQRGESAGGSHRRTASTPTWARATRAPSSQGVEAARSLTTKVVSLEVAKTPCAAAALGGVGAAGQVPLSSPSLPSPPSGAENAGAPGLNTSTQPEPAAMMGQVISTSRERPPHLQRIRLCAERLHCPSMCTLQEHCLPQGLLQQMQQQIVLLREQQEQQHAILQQHLLQQQCSQPVLMQEPEHQESQLPAAGRQQHTQAVDRPCAAEVQGSVPWHQEPLVLGHCEPSVAKPVVTPGVSNLQQQQQQTQTPQSEMPTVESSIDETPQRKSQESLPQNAEPRRVQSTVCLVQQSQQTSRKCAACHPAEKSGRCFCCCCSNSKRPGSAAAVPRQQQQCLQQKPAATSPISRASRAATAGQPHQYPAPVSPPARQHEQEQRHNQGSQRPQLKQQQLKDEPRLLVLALPSARTKTFLLCGPGQEVDGAPLRMSEQQHKQLLQLLHGRYSGARPPGSWRPIEGSRQPSRSKGVSGGVQQHQSTLHAGRDRCHLQRNGRSEDTRHDRQQEWQMRHPTGRSSCNCCCCGGCSSIGSGESTCSSESSDSAGDWLRHSQLRHLRNGTGWSETTCAAQQHALIDELLQMRHQAAHQGTVPQGQQQQHHTSPIGGAAAAPHANAALAASPSSSIRTGMKDSYTPRLLPSNSAPATATAALSEAGTRATFLPSEFLRSGNHGHGVAKHQGGLKSGVGWEHVPLGCGTAESRSEPLLALDSPDGPVSTAQFKRALGALLRGSPHRVPGTGAAADAPDGAAATGSGGFQFACRQVPADPAGEAARAVMEESVQTLPEQPKNAYNLHEQHELHHQLIQTDPIQPPNGQQLEQPLHHKQVQTLLQQEQPFEEQLEEKLPQQQELPLKHSLQNPGQQQHQQLHQEQSLQREQPIVQQQAEKPLQQQLEEPSPPQPQSRQRQEQLKQPDGSLQSAAEAAIGKTRGSPLPSPTEPPVLGTRLAEEQQGSAAQSPSEPPSGVLLADSPSSPLMAGQQTPPNVAAPAPPKVDTPWREHHQWEVQHPSPLQQQQQLVSSWETAKCAGVQSPTTTDKQLAVPSDPTPRLPQAAHPSGDQSPPGLLQSTTQRLQQHQKGPSALETDGLETKQSPQRVHITTERNLAHSISHGSSSNNIRNSNTAAQDIGSRSPADTAIDTTGGPQHIEILKQMAPARSPAADRGSPDTMQAIRGPRRHLVQHRGARTRERTVVVLQKQLTSRDQRQKTRGPQQQQQQPKQQQEQRHGSREQQQLHLRLSTGGAVCIRSRKLPRPVSAPQGSEQRNGSEASGATVVGRLREAPRRILLKDIESPAHTVRVRSHPVPGKEPATPGTCSAEGGSHLMQRSSEGKQYLQQQQLLHQQQQVLLQQQQVLEQQRLLLQKQGTHRHSPHQHPEQQGGLLPSLHRGQQQELRLEGWRRPPQAGTAEADSLTSSPSSNWSGSVSSGEVIVTPTTRRRFVCVQANTLGPLQGPLYSPTIHGGSWALHGPYEVAPISTSLLGESVAAEASSTSPSCAGIRMLLPVARHGSIRPQNAGPGLRGIALGASSEKR